MSSDHSGSNPNLFKLLFHTVNGNGGVNGLEFKEKTRDSNCGIVRSLTLRLKRISYLAAISVDAEADAVYKFVVLIVNGYGRKILYVIVYKEGLL